MPTNHTVTIDVADVSFPEAVLDATSVPNLLVSGPPMTDKFSLMIALLVDISERSMVVTTKHPAADVLASYGSASGSSSGTIGVVDTVDDSNKERTREGSELIRYVGSPGNLTRIGIEFSNLLDSFPGSGDRIGVGLHTLSPLIMHAGLQPVYRFLGALTARVRREGHRSVVVLDTPVAEYDVESLRHHFDAAIETRVSDDGGEELRVTGRRDVTSEWLSY